MCRLHRSHSVSTTGVRRLRGQPSHSHRCRLSRWEARRCGPFDPRTQHAYRPGAPVLTPLPELPRPDSRPHRTRSDRLRDATCHARTNSRMQPVTLGQTPRWYMSVAAVASDDNSYPLTKYYRSSGTPLHTTKHHSAGFATSAESRSRRTI